MGKILNPNYEIAYQENTDWGRAYSERWKVLHTDVPVEKFQEIFKVYVESKDWTYIRSAIRLKEMKKRLFGSREIDSPGIIFTFETKVEGEEKHRYRHYRIKPVLDVDWKSLDNLEESLRKNAGNSYR